MLQIPNHSQHPGKRARPESLVRNLYQPSTCSRPREGTRRLDGGRHARSGEADRPLRLRCSGSVTIAAMASATAIAHGFFHVAGACGADPPVRGRRHPHRSAISYWRGGHDCLHLLHALRPVDVAHPHPFVAGTAVLVQLQHRDGSGRYARWPRVLDGRPHIVVGGCLRGRVHFVVCLRPYFTGRPVLRVRAAAGPLVDRQ
mmetsp:Transcript_27573/g.83954  ORF Transcript_27573/g.83954 Transcript_27573/m.83954 type:complete len:201 (+) Transcript_27573:1270-1872(+)